MALAPVAVALTLALVLAPSLLPARSLPTAEPLQSSRLARVVEEIAQGDLTAIDRFWGEASKQGTPLVEPIEGDLENVLVTFLFRGNEDVKNVVVCVNNGLWGDIPTNRMERLGETDIWHKTYRFRRDARFTYSLSVNDSLASLRDVKDVEEWVKRSATWRTDPLNPLKFPSYPRPLSVVELPGAPPQYWVEAKPDVPKGKVQAHKIKSSILGNERTVWIYTPSGYDPVGTQYGLLLLFDGGAYINWVPTPTILDNLFSEGRIPPLVALMVSHPDQPTRDRELTCSDSFTRFLVEELKPWLHAICHVTEDPGLTVIGGSSYGGLGAAYAAFRHPDIFGNVLSQSGGFMYSPPEESEPEWLIRQFASSPALPIRFHVDAGLMEDWSLEGTAPSILMTNRHFRDVLLAKGYSVHYQEFNGGHEYLNWRGTLADGLIALLGEKASRERNGCDTVIR